MIDVKKVWEQIENVKKRKNVEKVYKNV